MRRYELGLHVGIVDQCAKLEGYGYAVFNGQGMLYAHQLVTSIT